jgi:hypothetical protein
MNREHRHGAACRAGSDTVGPAGEDHRHPGSQDQTRAVCVGQETELLRKNVARLEIRRQQDVGITGDLGANAFGSSRRLADGVVKRQRSIQDGAGNLSAFRHLAECSGIDGGGHLRSHGLHSRKDRHLGFFET